MNAVKQILLREIETLNQQEQRDNKPRFSFTFMKKHPGLWVSMYLCYALTAALTLSDDFLGWPAFWGATAFVLLMSLLMLFDINPRYRFEDIDALDLRVCFSGEWFYVRTLSPQAIEEILTTSEVPGHIRQGVRNWSNKKVRLIFMIFTTLPGGKNQPQQFNNPGYLAYQQRFAPLFLSHVLAHSPTPKRH
ncbi:MAG: Inner membrane protein YlaC [Candidatus Erwinia impunctatus]|nr:Inner membrane protein YlaC [Culicoides impunctatus]